MGLADIVRLLLLAAGIIEVVFSYVVNGVVLIVCIKYLGWW